jgi:pyruvate kinase
MLDIYGTIGPACREAAILQKMFEAGMTGIRLNLSHVTLEESAPLIENLHKAAAEAGVSPQLLIDMQGPELRVGRMEPLPLHEGETVFLGNQCSIAVRENGSADDSDTTHDAGSLQPLPKVPVPDSIVPFLAEGQEVLLDDGKILLEVSAQTEGGAFCRIIRGGTLTGRKSIALPGVSIRTPTMTETDLANIRVAKEYGVTAVMQPFVRDRQDIETVRQALYEAGAGDIRIFAKIENMDGVKCLDELLPVSDEIVIARGDLGNAVPLWELPAVQKMIAEKCRNAGVPFMVVTQMLASMEKSAVPTRAEVSDIFNAVLDGAASVMVTGETAVGQYPVDVISYLAKTAACAEEFLRDNIF